MKKIMLIIMSMFFATSLYAEVLVVNPGSQEGAFRQILTTINSELDADFVQADNPVTAYSYIEGTDSTELVVTIWSSEWPGDNSLKSPIISKDNIIALMTYETLMCSRAYNSLEDMSGKTVKIATWGSEPVAKFLKNLGAKHNVTFEVVPYGGSGSTTKGYIGKDADTVFTITSRQAALEEDTSTKCIAFSEKGDLGFRFLDAIITVNANEAFVNDLRSTVANLSNTAEWNDKFKGSVTYIGNGTNQTIDMFEEAVANFSK
tara:strand:- start:1232 stop:2014 length:783 start_codon:yes stop_codon:yes gene_type:complete